MSGILQSLVASIGGGAPPAYIEDVFSTFLYNGNSSTQTINNGINLAGEGGLTWIKSRSATTDHFLFDTNRGALNEINSNTTDIQTSLAGSLTSFNADGFSLGAAAGINVNSVTYCSWTFRKQPKFFDIVTYTGNGANRTIAHNLGSVPGMIIVKRLGAFTNDWPVWHRRSPTFGEYVLLNSTATTLTNSQVFTTTAPTDSVFSVGTDFSTNQSGGTYVAYLFAHNAGGFGATGTQNAITCDSFTKNFGSPVNVNLGYEPQYIMIKYLASNQDWQVYDVMRGLSDTTSNQRLAPNTSAAESSANVVTPTATGFTMAAPLSGGSYMYMAIRRGPMRTPTNAATVFQPTTGSFVETASNPAVSSVTTDLYIELFRNGGFPNRFWDRLRGSFNSLSANTINSETAFTDAVSFAAQTGVTFGGNWITSPLSLARYFFRRAPGFFDIVSYTGTGSITTQAHNLGVVPELMIVKQRNNSNIDGWVVYGNSVSTTLLLQLTASAFNGGSSNWNNTAPTASVFTLGTNAAVNGSGITFVAYLFASIAGVSKVGSYTGTGATQTINCAFTTGARFVLIKRTDSTSDWFVWDTARGMTSGTDPRYALNSTAAEINNNWVFTETTGFQIVTTDAAVNASGGSYIFLAIA